MTESAQDAFNRGYESGRVNTRLDGHDAQIAAMSSALTKAVDIEAQLTLTVQSLGLAAKAGEEKALALAVALKDQAEERRNKSSQEATDAQKKWTPFQMGLLVITALTGAGLLLLTYIRG